MGINEYLCSFWIIDLVEGSRSALVAVRDRKLKKVAASVRVQAAVIRLSTNRGPSGGSRNGTDPYPNFGHGNPGRSEQRSLEKSLGLHQYGGTQCQ